MFCREVFAAMETARKNGASADDLIVEIIITMAQFNMWKKDNMQYIGTMLSIAGFDKKEVRKILVKNHLEQDWWFRTYGLREDDETESRNTVGD
jgi:hypothetical protein